MKFSEAIRLGAMFRPQSFGSMFTEFDEETGVYGGETCAFGAAVDAAQLPVVLKSVWEASSIRPVEGFVSGRAWQVVIPKDWQPYLTAWLKCSKCEHKASGRMLISHMNDEHRLTREAIADFVETFELDAEQKHVENSIAVTA